MNIDQTEVKNLESAILTSPLTLTINGISYSLLEKVTDKILNRELGMVNKIFSNQLYQKSEEIWKKLRDEVYQSTQEFRSTHHVIVKDGVVIAVSQKSDFEDFYLGAETLAKSCKATNFTVNYNGSYLLEAYINTESGLGVHIEYFLDEDYVRARSFLLNEEHQSVYVNPVPIVSTVIEYSFSKILDYSVLAQYLDTSNIIEYSYKDFISKLEVAQLSVGEIISRLKSDLGIKYIPELSAYDIAAEDERFDQNTTNILDYILSQINIQSKIAQYAQPLKKEVTFVVGAKYYYFLLSRLAYSDKIEYHKLADFVESVLSCKLNYNQLNS